MLTRCSRFLLIPAAAIGMALVAAAFSPAFAQSGERPFQDTFPVDKADLASTGKNTYFALEPGYQLTFEGMEGKKKVQLVITVTDEIVRVDGIDTRVVEERESADGEIVEVSRNFFAISKSTSDVFYFGEDVDIYKNGKVVKHEGAWRSGKDGARFGLMMPGKATVGARFYQEHAPGVAMDRFEIVSLRETAQLPAGKYDNCLKAEESTPLEPGDKEYKLYAPGVGLIQDGSLLLTRVGKASTGG